MTVYNNLIDTSLPDGGDDPAEADNNMRRIQLGFHEILAVEHNVDLTGTVITGDAGHTDITCDSITNAGVLTQTGNFTLNTNKFTVDAATGNVVVAGTLDVTGIATLGDGSKMATSATPTADTELANKKYVDDQDTADHPAYTGGESHTDGSGLIFKHGSSNVGAGATDTVTYETAFPTGFVSASVSMGNVGAAAASVVSCEPTSGSETISLQIYNGNGSTRKLYWQAWGY